ncbi:MAG: 4'-phosphopantetheinyl transferase superfamily protein [Cyanobacteria bacterium]|nr:4'-phosphopantetheinyl transferase superfamily protein [Cyanobacteriota bacterium]MDW8202897.1 4'-phosphopantetheinyl transferase superfamily protein [Cyanobacteriota bacterium SKYGB_h_bin112]
MTLIQTLNEYLSPDERQRAERFRFPRDRQRFVAGRGWLRTLLARYLNITPTLVQFEYLSHGKPVLVNDPTIQFNLSHSQDLALCVVTRQHAVGIDVEYLRPVAANDIAQRFFRPNEWTTLATLNPEEQQSAFFRYWTCKEAYLKACGDGLGKLQSVEVSLGNQAQLIWLENDRGQQWFLQEFQPAHGYTAALVVATAQPNLHFWDAA